jgi:uncharacterized protein
MREQDDFGALVGRHRPRLRAVAFAILGDREEAEDVVQETLLRGFLALATLRRRDRAGAWLVAIAANLARMRLRQGHMKTIVLDGELALGCPEEEPMLEEVREALEALPASAREVLLAHYVEGFSCAEIAERAGSTPGAVRVRLHRARGQLRALLPAFASANEEVEMIEVVVDDVWVRIAPGSPDRLADERLRIVLLREKDGERVLPIWIGPSEGDALMLELRGEAPPRPLTSDLTTRLLEAAGGRVERVVVTKLEEQTFYAVVAVASGDGIREVDARPSDALNLALRAGAAIYVDGVVLEQASLVGEERAALLDEAYERHGQESVVERPPTGEWRPHSLDLATAYRRPPA